MCGIAGIARGDGAPVDATMLLRMTDVLAHRGPDGHGIHVDGAVGLGHRRLAIIDLTTGRQPMSSDDGRLWITFNGEIYNFRELRTELAARGYRFRTTSDTEVLLASYEAWGPECLSRLRGMFAFGIWDRERRRLFLARDRVGIKPLVYACDPHRLLFASELKAILQDPVVPRELDWHALCDYLVFHYIPAPRTIFRAIRKLPAGCYMLWDARRQEPEIHRYWDLHFTPAPVRSDAEWMEGLRWHLQEAVRTHLVSDVPIGAFLSGGMDSSTVVALMAQGDTSPVRTFSVGFDETEYDELRYARMLARRYGTEHYELTVKADALQALPKLTWQFDEPFADSSALPTYYVAKATREHVTVALSGDGGDENFAGYRRYATASAIHERLDRGAGVLARRICRTASRFLPPGMRGQPFLELLGSDPVDRYFQLMSYQRTSTLRRLLTARARAEVPCQVDSRHFKQLGCEAVAPDYVSTLQYLDVRTYLPDDILTKVDRASMLVSLEARVPLLDHILMEYVATMPSGLKLRGGAGKAILKQAMVDALPPPIVGRRKMGFGVPLPAWFRGEFGRYAREVLTSRLAREREVFDPSAVMALLEEHRQGRRDRSSQIWAMLCFEEWARQWWDAP